MSRGFSYLPALLLGLSLAAPAATLQYLTLDQISQSATAIVRAKVTASSASFTGKTIYTHYKLQVSEAWKGSATELMLPGGVAGGFRQSFPGVPELQVGSEYVMYLWTSKVTGITQLVGLTQGLFNVSASTTSNALVWRPANADSLLDANLRPLTDQPVSMTLSAMKSRVIAAMGGKVAAQ
jgi:hypothetical protein